MKRRSFVVSMANGLTLLSISPILLQCTVPDYDPHIANPLLLKYIWDPETIMEIGQVFIEMNPDINSERALVKTLLMKFNTDTTFEKEIMDDFSAEQFVQLKGWILSETEAQQCALFYILAKNI